MPGMRTVVVSSTLRPQDYSGVTIIGKDAEAAVAKLRAGPGKDIWLFGGGELFRRLLAAGLVDGVEVAVMPTLLGAGVPLLPSPAARAGLDLKSHRAWSCGIVSLEYAVSGSTN
jgi:dihydrofolate reductase